MQKITALIALFGVATVGHSAGLPRESEIPPTIRVFRTTWIAQHAKFICAERYPELAEEAKASVAVGLAEIEKAELMARAEIGRRGSVGARYLESLDKQNARDTKELLEADPNEEPITLDQCRVLVRTIAPADRIYRFFLIIMRKAVGETANVHSRGIKRVA
jgi:hypothetical protein